jgi:uncharacterized protein (DUF2461 family)
MAAAISGKTRMDHTEAGFYFSFGLQSLHVAGGAYRPDREGVYNIRSQIVENLEVFDRLLSDKEFLSTYGELKGERNKILPKEFKAFGQKQPLLFHKQFYYYAELEAESIFREDLAERLMKYYLIGRPVCDFLRTALKRESPK